MKKKVIKKEVAPLEANLYKIFFFFSEGEGAKFIANYEIKRSFYKGDIRKEDLRFSEYIENYLNTNKQYVKSKILLNNVKSSLTSKKVSTLDFFQRKLPSFYKEFKEINRHRKTINNYEDILKEFYNNND